MFFYILVNALLKPEGIVANLIATTSMNGFVFALGYINITSLQINMFSLITLLIVIHYFFDRSPQYIHVCHALKRHLLV